jgi:hypothetical protein
MKKIYFLFICLFVFAGIKIAAQTTTFCNPNGNIIIYSNYDGGKLTINVDQNIPNLKIGICTYESVQIIITGTYAANVTEVRYAGYNGSNDNCNLGVTNTTITGVPNNVDTIIVYPAVGYSNPNGNPSMVCNYSCSSTTNQGGCNTPDQIVAYFQAAFGETTGSLYYHHTQYNCWNGTYNVSAGGNCCIVPISTSIAENNSTENNLTISPNPSTGNFHVELPTGISTGELKIFNVLGEEVQSVKISGAANISLEGEAPGIYFVKFVSGDKMFTQKIVLEK